MTKLIVYIDSDQKVSAYKIDDNNAYSISFYGNDYETDLSQFAEIVMEDLMASPLSKMESRGGISVLIVSNGAANETVRTVISLLMHDDDEDGILNVNIQELNVIEAKYFLSMIGNPENPYAKDFAQFFDLSQKAMTSESEVEDLKKKNSELEEKIKELNESEGSKDSAIREMENKLKKIDSDKAAEDRKLQEEEKLSESIYKIDFLKDAENTGVSFYLPKGNKVTFHKTYKNGDMVSKYSTIASYRGGRYSSDLVNISAKRSGRLYYFFNDNSEVCNGDVVAVIGESSWTKDDAIYFLKQSQNPKKKEPESLNEKENVVIVKADVIDNFVSETNVEPDFRYIPADNLKDGDFVSENTVLFTIREIYTNTEFTLKAPCVGKVFFLVQIDGEEERGVALNLGRIEYHLKNSQLPMAMIVPEFCSKSQAVDWYRNNTKIEPHQIADSMACDIENMLPNGALVLPNDIIYKRYSIPFLAQKTGKIRYFQGCPNNRYSVGPDEPIAEIY